MDKTRRIIEVERIQNLVRNFGWEVDTIVEHDETLMITFKKTISSEPLVSA